MYRPRLRTGFRAIAVYEAAKGAVVLFAGLGLLRFLGTNLQQEADHIVALSHLDPASRYPRIFLDTAAHLTDAHLWLFAGLAALYAAGRMVLAYGLWNERPWAEWVALVAVSVYLPMEIYDLVERQTWPRFGLFAVNLAVAGYLAAALIRSRRREPPKPVEAR